ncbi:MAG: hypothetical protein MI922_29910, partial [Bacteroidales bacterium]|nr:hypothetical protein [Bacteroidales bacterium]
DRDASFLTLVIFLLSLTILAGSIYQFWRGAPFFYLYCVLGKSIIDAVLFLCIRPVFNKPLNLFLIPLIELVYPVYILAVAINANLRSFTWKNRRF